MLSINSGPPVAWPTAAPVTVAPVTAVTAVTPAQRSSGDGNAGLDSGRRGQTSGPEPAAAAADVPEAAPLLPRERTDGGREQASAETADAAAKAEQREKALAKAEEKAEEKPAELKLQDVLANVWKASAAVVDAVLGRDATGVVSAQGGNPARSAADPSLVVAAQRPHGEASPIGDAADPLVDPRNAQDVVAYDERGAGSLALLETGSLVNQRV